MGLYGEWHVGAAPKTTRGTLAHLAWTIADGEQIVDDYRTAFPSTRLIMLTAAAIVMPIATKRNLYCSHLCPHGALQQLALRFARPQRRFPRPWRIALSWLPAGLLVFCLVVALTHWPFDLANIEPFDAYVFRVAGWGTLAVAVVGGVASLFIPMAYCRYGCPTGALLGYLRLNARSDRLTRRDLVAAACVALAALLWWAEK